MGEEVKMSEYEANGDNNGNGEERVRDWEFGLPTVDDLMPLSQPLIPPELASAFRISPEPHRTLIDVNRESENTLLGIRSGGALSSNNFKSYNNDDDDDPPEETAAEGDKGKLRRLDSGEEADSVLRTENMTGEDPDGAAARSSKRPRLVWTPQLHKRFVDVVAYLGIKNAVPKTIMQLMNVEGLTRENVASHLQKYRLYLKRMQGEPSTEPSASASDHHLFASTPVPRSLQDNGNSNGGANGHVGMPVPYHPGMGPIMPMPMYGMQMANNNNHSNSNNSNNNYNSMLQQRDWRGINNFHM